MSLLKLAIEGEKIEVVEGMFTAVPIGTSQEHQALIQALESMEETIDQIDEASCQDDVRPYLSGDEPITSEIALEGFKDVVKKIWAAIKKFIAGLLAVYLGFIKWMATGFGRHRSLTKEIIRQYHDYVDMLNNAGVLSDQQAIVNIAKADGLDKEYGNKLTPVAKSLLTDNKYLMDFLDFLKKIKIPEYAGNIKENFDDILKNIDTFTKKAQEIDHAGKNTSGEQNAVVDQTALKEFQREVIHSGLDASATEDNTIPKAIGDIVESRAALADEKFSFDQPPNAYIHTLSGAFKLLRLDDLISLREIYFSIMKVFEEKLKVFQTKVDHFEKQIDSDPGQASIFLSRAFLSYLGYFKGAIHNVMKITHVVEETMSSTINAIDTTLDFLEAVIGRFKKDHTGMMGFRVWLQWDMKIKNLRLRMRKEYGN